MQCDFSDAQIADARAEAIKRGGSYKDVDSPSTSGMSNLSLQTSEWASGATSNPGGDPPAGPSNKSKASGSESVVKQNSTTTSAVSGAFLATSEYTSALKKNGEIQERSFEKGCKEKK